VVVSLDEPADGATVEAAAADPAAGDPEREILAREQAHALAAALAALPARKREVVARHFGVGRAAGTLRQAAAAIGVSERRAQTLQRDALYELRDRLEEART
jgi:RNA polymerase sigma factor (sigma-70 family)